MRNSEFKYACTRCGHLYLYLPGSRYISYSSLTGRPYLEVNSTLDTCTKCAGKIEERDENNLIEIEIYMKELTNAN